MQRFRGVRALAPEKPLGSPGIERCAAGAGIGHLSVHVPWALPFGGDPIEEIMRIFRHIRAFLWVLQVGPTNEDFRRDACVSLACHIAHVSAFQKLRTELQLGCATGGGGAGGRFGSGLWPSCLGFWVGATVGGWGGFLLKGFEALRPSCLAIIEWLVVLRAIALRSRLWDSGRWGLSEPIAGGFLKGV